MPDQFCRNTDLNGKEVPKKYNLCENSELARRKGAVKLRYYTKKGEAMEKAAKKLCGMYMVNRTADINGAKDGKTSVKVKCTLGTKKMSPNKRREIEFTASCEEKNNKMVCKPDIK